MPRTPMVLRPPKPILKHCSSAIHSTKTSFCQELHPIMGSLPTKFQVKTPSGSPKTFRFVFGAVDRWEDSPESNAHLRQRFRQPTQSLLLSSSGLNFC